MEWSNFQHQRHFEPTLYYKDKNVLGVLYIFSLNYLLLLCCRQNPRTLSLIIILLNFWIEILRKKKLLLAILLFYVAIQMWVDVKINKLTITTTESVQTQLFAVSLGDSLEFNESFIINNDNKQQLATAASPSTSVGISSGIEPVRQPIIQQIVSTQQRQQFI